MKTIIMLNPIMESIGSMFPRVQITFDEASAECKKTQCRLPTESEYEQLFTILPWPFLIYEWSMTESKSTEEFVDELTKEKFFITTTKQVIIGGGHVGNHPKATRALNKANVTEHKANHLGFRFARDIDDNDQIPEGWIELPKESV